jgi:hypothetical protein
VLDPQAIYDAYATTTTPGELMTLWGGPAADGSGGVYVGGLETTGVNEVLNEPYWIDAIGADGAPKNVQHIDMIEVP